MRIVSQAEYTEAKEALAVYETFCVPYVQRNGWTVIPADAPRPDFNGSTLTTERINAYSTDVELYRLSNDKPKAFSAYYSGDGHSAVTTWTGEQIGTLIWRGEWRNNNFGARWRSVRMHLDWEGTFSGREYTSRQLINFRRVKPRSWERRS